MMVHGPQFNLPLQHRVLHVHVMSQLAHSSRMPVNFLEDAGTVKHDHRQRSENATVTKNENAKRVKRCSGQI